MVPDIDLQLQSAIKALADTIAPAIDPADKMASEQAHLVIGTLRMARERLPVQRRFIRRLLEDAIRLGKSVQASEADDALAAAIGEGQAALADPELEAHEIEAVRARLSRITAELIAQAGAEGLARFGAAVARDARASVDRLRAWSAPSGFEPHVASMTPLEALL